MEDNRKFHKLGFLLLMVLIIAVLSLCSVMVPGTLYLAILANTVMFTVLLIKSGFDKAFAAPVVSLLLVYLITGNILAAVSAVLSYLLTGLLLALCVRRKLSISKTLILVSLGFMAYLFSSFYFISAAANKSISAYLYDQVKSSVEFFVQNINIQAVGINSPEISQMMDQINSDPTALIDSIMQVIASFMIVYCAVIGYIMIVITKTVLKKLSVDIHFWKDFKDLRLENTFSILMVVTMIVVYFVKESIIAVAFTNMLILFMFLLGFCGYTLLDFFMVKKGLKKPLRVLILVLLFLISIMFFAGLYIANYILIFLGLMDSSFNFRKRMDKGDGENGQKKIL